MSSIKLFTIGPVQLYPSTATVRAKGFPHFRTVEYGNTVKASLQEVSKLMGCTTPNGLIYMSCSGTGAMEATIENCVSDNDKVLVINGGTFGHRFCELLAFHEKSYEAVDLKWNETLTVDHLAPFEKKGYTMLFVNLHETSTGQLYNIELLSAFCKRNGLMLVVDAIATFLADPYDMDRYGIDVTIISSQKGLCLSPGMSILAFSPRMVEKIKSGHPKSVYFNFNDYLVNIPRGQTPYTPPVCVMYELEDMLSLIRVNGGLEGRLKEIAEKANYFRERATELGFKFPPYPLSNMLTPVYFEDIDAEEVIHRLADRYGIYVNPCGGQLAHRLFRVSHIGNTSLGDIDEILSKLVIIVNEMKGE